MNRLIKTLILIGGAIFFASQYSYSQITTCSYAVTTSLDPPPNNCGYYTGDTVTLCFDFGGFQQKNSNWIHGFVFDIGSGWDTTGLKNNITLPYSCSGLGYWAYYPKDSSYASGQTFGPGIYFDWNTSYFPADGVPGNNYGDQNVGFCTWHFCVKLKVGPVPSTDLHFAVRATADGISGDWTTPPSCKTLPILADTVCKPLSSSYKCLMSISNIVTEPGCKPNTGAVTVRQTGGFGNVSYTWSNGNTTDTTLTGLNVGTYSVTAVDGHACQQIATSVLKINDSARININVIDTIDCYGHCNGKVQAVTTGNAPYTYNWSNGGTTDIQNGLCTGSYKVIVTDKHQCIDSAAITLTSPPTSVITITKQDARCFGSSDGSAVATITPSAVYAFAWVPASIPNDTVSTSNNLQNVPSGTYLLTATESNGCITKSGVVINQPGPIRDSIAVKNIKCFGGSTGQATVQAYAGFGPFTYQWSNGPTNTTVQGLPIGSYSVKITDSTGCSILDTVTLTQPQALRIDFTQVPASCDIANDGALTAAVYGGTRPYSYFWAGGAAKSTDSFATNLKPGRYYLTVSDGNACVDSGSTHLVSYPRFSVDLGPNQEIKDGYSAIIVATPNSPGNFTYEWTPHDGLDYTTGYEVNASPTTTTTYSVTVTDEGTGCKFENDVVVTVLPNYFLFVPNAFSPNGDGINNTIFPIAGVGVTIKDFRIFDRWGAVMYSGISTTEGWDGNYHGAPQNVGVYTYYCEYSTPDGTESRKQGTILLLR